MEIMECFTITGYFIAVRTFFNLSVSGHCHGYPGGYLIQEAARWRMSKRRLGCNQISGREKTTEFLQDVFKLVLLLSSPPPMFLIHLK